MGHLDVASARILRTNPIRPRVALPILTPAKFFSPSTNWVGQHTGRSVRVGPQN